ncbi:hypothetical protein DFS34DRAFT_619289 [Phlyctochytrium arcticum]|nr:hypothetical protein DFS34DRAFT_619289 [Phlyctochytrium arcticum]
MSDVRRLLKQARAARSAAPTPSAVRKQARTAPPTRIAPPTATLTPKKRSAPSIERETPPAKAVKKDSSPKPLKSDLKHAENVEVHDENREDDEESRTAGDPTSNSIDREGADGDEEGPDVASNLPAGFFDAKAEPTIASTSAAQPTPTTDSPATTLPATFFHKNARETSAHLHKLADETLEAEIAAFSAEIAPDLAALDVIEQVEDEQDEEERGEDRRREQGAYEDRIRRLKEARQGGSIQDRMAGEDILVDSDSDDVDEGSGARQAASVRTSHLHARIPLPPRTTQSAPSNKSSIRKVFEDEDLDYAYDNLVDDEDEEEEEED